MKIDDKMISYLEESSRLEFSDKEKSCLADELEKIMNGINKLSELNTEGVAECCHVFDNKNVFREDTIQPSFDRELILQNAPARNEEFFIAPKTVD